MVAETAEHAGQADIIRELIDGKGGPDQDSVQEPPGGTTSPKVQAAANAVAVGTQPQPRQ
jgi:Protein of unknown function (DUF664)